MKNHLLCPQEARITEEMAEELIGEVGFGFVAKKTLVHKKGLQGIWEISELLKKKVVQMDND